MLTRTLDDRSWASNTFSPTSKRGVGTAFIVSISNCISMCVRSRNDLLDFAADLPASASPQIYFDDDDDYRKGHGISAA